MLLHSVLAYFHSCWGREVAAALLLAKKVFFFGRGLEEMFVTF